MRPKNKRFVLRDKKEERLSDIDHKTKLNKQKGNEVTGVMELSQKRNRRSLLIYMLMSEKGVETGVGNRFVRSINERSTVRVLWREKGGQSISTFSGVF